MFVAFSRTVVGTMIGSVVVVPLAATVVFVTAKGIGVVVPVSGSVVVVTVPCIVVALRKDSANIS